MIIFLFQDEKPTTNVVNDAFFCFPTCFTGRSGPALCTRTEERPLSIGTSPTIVTGNQRDTLVNI